MYLVNVKYLYKTTFFSHLRKKFLTKNLKNLRFVKNFDLVLTYMMLHAKYFLHLSSYKVWDTAHRIAKPHKASSIKYLQAVGNVGFSKNFAYALNG